MLMSVIRIQAVTGLLLAMQSQVMVCILEACGSNRLALLVKFWISSVSFGSITVQYIYIFKETKVDASLALFGC